MEEFKRIKEKTYYWKKNYSTIKGDFFRTYHIIFMYCLNFFNLNVFIYK